MTWTAAMIEALPINGGSHIVTDAETGISLLIPNTQRFLVTDDDTYCVTNRRTGERWRIGVDMHGEYWKERLHF